MNNSYLFRAVEKVPDAFTRTELFHAAKRSQGIEYNSLMGLMRADRVQDHPGSKRKGLGKPLVYHCRRELYDESSRDIRPSWSIYLLSTAVG